MTVLSIQKHQIALGAGVFNAQADLTGDLASDTSSCVPFVMTRVTAISSSNADSLEDYLVRTEFISGSPNKVRCTRVGGATENQAALVCEVTVVEFDPTKVNVYSGQATVSGASQTLTVSAAFGAGPVTVDTTKAWLYFTYATAQTADRWRAHTMRGEIAATSGSPGATESTLYFEKVESQSTDQLINWWVCECINTEWTVQPISISLSDAQTSNTVTITSVDLSKTFVLGSYEGADASADGDGNDENTFDVAFDDATTVSLTRQTASGVIDWRGFVVELNGSESVQRGQLQQSTSQTTENVALSPSVTEDNCMVHTAGHLGTIGGGSFPSTSDSSDDLPDALCAWTFVGSPTATAIQCAHSVNGGEASQNITWEVIDWAVGGAPPATSRRVMVIS